MTEMKNGNGRIAGSDAPELNLPVAEHHERSSSAMHSKSNSTKIGKTPTLDVKAAEAYLKAGYELIPLQAGGKAASQVGWPVADPLTLSGLRKHMDKGGNVGVRLRAEDLVIDVDPRNGGDESFDRLQQDFPLPDAPTVITGSGGRHIYLRKPADLNIASKLAVYPGIDFKKCVGYVVAAGSLTKEPYHWDPLLDSHDLSATASAPAELLAALQKSSRVSSREAGECTPEQLEALLEGLDPCDFSDYGAWLEIGMSAHHGTNGSDEGMEVFVAWSERDPIYAGLGDETRAKWASFSIGTGKSVTLGTLLSKLNKAGRGDLVDAFNRTPAEEDFPDDETDQGALPVSEERDIIDRMNGRFCAVLEGGKFVIFMEDSDSSFTPPRPVWTRMSRADFLHYHEDERMKPVGSRRDISVAEHWLASPRRRKFSGIVLDPDGNDHDKLNLWQGWAVRPKPGSWSLMRELIERVLCSNDAAVADYVLRWMAFMFQKPGTSPEVAIAFRGGQGTGKGTLGRALMSIAGAHGLTVASPQQFAGRFNAHLRSVAFLFADEAFWPGHKESEGVLKQLLTEPVISYEGKGANIVPGRNLVHLMMASNNDWIVPASLDQRRFVVSDVSDERKGDRAFFAKLNKQMMEEGGLAAMLHDLTLMDLGGWHPSHNIPQTQALAEQKAHSLEPAAKFWMDLLDKGVLPITEIVDWESGTVDLSALGKSELRDEYDRFLKANRLHYAKASHKALVSAGRAFGLLTRKKNGAERQWQFPPLAEARHRFEDSLGGVSLFGD